MLKWWQIKGEIKYVIGSFLVHSKGLNKQSNECLNALKGKYKGRRCFVLGNGPSLTASDLDMLKGEITFASNAIYKIFSETSWRPTYYAIFDEGVGAREGMLENASKLDCIKFFREQGYLVYRKAAGKNCYIHTWHSRKYLDDPHFSENLTSGLYTIATVTYSMIQIARWMGFDEIYLLGMDNKYKFSQLRDGTVVRNEGVCNYFGEEAKEEPLPATAPATWENDAAYEYAEKYSREHGFRIYNATRGGFLEKFERVDLDEVLSEK